MNNSVRIFYTKVVRGDDGILREVLATDLVPFLPDSTAYEEKESYEDNMERLVMDAYDCGFVKLSSDHFVSILSIKEFKKEFNPDNQKPVQKPVQKNNSKKNKRGQRKYQGSTNRENPVTENKTQENTVKEKTEEVLYDSYPIERSERPVESEKVQSVLVE